MIKTLPGPRDRAGHALVVAFVLLTLTGTAAAAQKKYRAERFDVSSRVTERGDLDIVERLTFAFEEGVFHEVWRDIPSRHTDAIDIVSASIDGVAAPEGDGTGQISVTGRSRRRVTWRFNTTGPATHTFELHYVLRGVVHPSGAGHLVRWQALPSQHAYAIGSSHVSIAIPVPLDDKPQIETRRVGTADVAVASQLVEVAVEAIRSNGWIAVSIQLPAGAVSSTPQWYERQEDARVAAPKWATGAAVLLLAGLFATFALRSPYSVPRFDEAGTIDPAPPDDVPPAIGGALLHRGRVPAGLAMATLLDLADRGVITIRELSRTLGVRQYELAQAPGAHDLTSHEQAALAIAFGDHAGPVTLSRARGRIARGQRRFTAAVEADLARAGLLDQTRRAVRDRLTVFGMTSLLAGLIAMIPMALLIERFGPYPLLLPLALVIVGLVALIAGPTTTSLSDEGLVRAARWRAFRIHLKNLAAARDDAAAAQVPPRWIGYAMAFGLAYQWSRYLKHHPDAVPPWFRALDPDGGTAWAAFVAAGATGGGVSGGAAGAAGGGGSGAA